MEIEFDERQQKKFKKNRQRRARQRMLVAIIRLITKLVIIAAVIGVIVLFIYLFCGLKSVVIEDSRIYNNQQVSEMVLNDEYCTNTVYAFLKNMIMPVKGVEFVDHFDVSITGMHALKIKVVEKSIVGYVINGEGKYVYFDDDGVVADITSTYLDGKIKVDGVECEEMEIGDQLAIGEREAMFLLSLNKILKKLELDPEQIHYDTDKTITLFFENYSIDVGDNVLLEDKMGRLKYIIPQIEDQKGVIHLENFSLDNTDIVFEKALEEEAEESDGESEKTDGESTEKTSEKTDSTTATTSN